VRKIEESISELVNRISAEGAYCCRLNEVRQMEKGNAVHHGMHCEQHKGLNFMVPYLEPVNTTGKVQKFDLIRRIAFGIVNVIGLR